MTGPAKVKIDIRRPVVVLAVAAVLSVGSIALPSLHGTDSVAVTTDGADTKAPAAKQGECGTIKDSLRPLEALPSPGAMPSGSTMEKIQQRGRLIAGVDQGKYLLGYRNPQTGQLEGADIDIVRMIAAAILGDPDKVQYVVRDVADRTLLIEQGQVDVVVNTFSATCDRQRAVEFSTGYYEATQRLLVPAKSGVDGIEQLAGKKVCTSIGSTTEVVLRKPEFGLDVVTLAGIPHCMVALQQGKVDAVSSDDGILAGMAAQDPQTRVVGRPLANAYYGVGMHPQQPDLVRFVNRLLERDRANGSLAASARKWLGAQLNPVPPIPSARYRD
ncbi:polar amino acid transport system substrate-binding protein [Saccharothrix ecbatanensis]|uniref:Polar amino acid transport system substrate-binding protein n=1 Tax=Saccharothrix ecbatanensis TaxID=1105145 RepID=A0A7W9HSB2_9PSEU|nr:glutamate ABC transporter substrate-binding protein [Saccharothrix ecbatanensis]MBB5807529.1 polar amino acid transport system substrate-binding protein [Saccharothrix ecbatanensis]